RGDRPSRASAPECHRPHKKDRGPELPRENKPAHKPALDNLLFLLRETSEAVIFPVGRPVAPQSHGNPPTELFVRQRLSFAAPGAGTCPMVASACVRKSVAICCTWASIFAQAASHAACGVPAF